MQEKLASRLHWRLTHTFDYCNVVTLQLDQNRNFAAKREVGKLYYRSRQNRCYSGIYRIATFLQHAQAGFDRERVAACDSPTFATDYGPECLS
jgi:hypothetical protein